MTGSLGWKREGSARCTALVTELVRLTYFCPSSWSSSTCPAAVAATSMPAACALCLYSDCSEGQQSAASGPERDAREPLQTQWEDRGAQHLLQTQKEDGKSTTKLAGGHAGSRESANLGRPGG